MPQLLSHSGDEPTAPTKAERTARRNFAEPFDGARSGETPTRMYCFLVPDVNPAVACPVQNGGTDGSTATAVPEDLPDGLETDASASSLVESRKRLS